MIPVNQHFTRQIHHLCTCGIFVLLLASAVSKDTPTYSNPVIWSDFPDCDIIRVGDTYYFWGSSAQYVPGATILSSKDLVNWEYCANVATRIENPAFDQIDESRYDRGVWAGTLRFHNGIWYNGWNEPDLGFFMFTANDPHGPWTGKYFGGRHLYDPGLFFDDDGKVYVAHGQGAISITELTADALDIKTPARQVHRGRGVVEGSHLYKRNGYYYILTTAYGDGFPHGMMALRSKSIYGPYEQKRILGSNMNWTGFGVHQGGIVDTPGGEWWAIIFQDRYPLGRTPTLQPVTWVDDWPMMGLDNGSKAVVTFPTPDKKEVQPRTYPATSDEFDRPVLGLQWQWNFNPDTNAFSLTERPGWLRLKTARSVGGYEGISFTGNGSDLKWKYTLAMPAQDWNKSSSFNDADWKTGEAPFGTEGTPSLQPRTEWSTADIWLRRTFNPGDASLANVRLRVFHDEDVEVYLNGVLAAKEANYVSAPKMLAISPEALATLKTNAENLIAVHCHQTGGGQGVDVSFARPVADVVNDLAFARNTLTQRRWGPGQRATVKLDISHMLDGDMAGLTCFERNYNFIGFAKRGNSTAVVINDNGTELASAPFSNSIIYLRAECPHLSRRVRYFYSADGKEFTPLGDTYPQRYLIYFGTKFGIFNFPSKKLGGHVDVDWFHVDTPDHGENLFAVNRTIDAERYDDCHACTTDWCADQWPNSDDQCMTSIVNGAWLQFDRIDFQTGGAVTFEARVASATADGTIELHLDQPDGPLMGSCAVSGTGDWKTYVTRQIPLKVPAGINKVFLVFKGGDGQLMNLNWFRFVETR